MDVRKMRQLRKGMEYQYICEDSKTRVYLSLVPSEAEKKRRRRETVWAFKKAITLVLGKGSAILIQTLFTAAVSILTYTFLAARLADFRGYSAVGSEVFFTACAGVLAFRAAYHFTRNWR